QAFSMHVRRLERGGNDHVAQDVDSEPRIVLVETRPVHGQRLVGGGVQDAAHALYGFGDLFRTAVARGTLEEHMFEEVGDPGLGVCLIAGTDGKEGSQAYRRPVRELRADDPSPGW